MKEGEEVPRIKFEWEFLLIETFMQLSVGNSELFSFDVPKPSTIFFFFLMGRPESKMAFKSDWF